MAGQVALFSSIYIYLSRKLQITILQLKMHIGDTDRKESSPTKVQTPEGKLEFLQHVSVNTYR